MHDWHNVHITDKTGAKHFNTTSSPMSTMSEIRNLKRHIEQAKKSPHMYKMLDVASAVVMLDGAPWGEPEELDADALLEELGL